ncbi:hypothetical protein MMC28_003511 [Mycoblastus sanguinarius]|nr:hypothetical protein [Mycoblastus sanguinarius]
MQGSKKRGLEDLDTHPTSHPAKRARHEKQSDPLQPAQLDEPRLSPASSFSTLIGSTCSSSPSSSLHSSEEDDTSGDTSSSSGAASESNSGSVLSSDSKEETSSSNVNFEIPQRIRISPQSYRYPSLNPPSQFTSSSSSNLESSKTSSSASASSSEASVTPARSARRPFPIVYLPRKSQEKVSESELEEDDSSSDDVSTSSSEYSSDFSSAPRPSVLQPLPSALTAENLSVLQSRLNSFLPSIRRANEELEVEKKEGRLEERDIENVDGSGEEGKGYIEMNLGLGVLEEKKEDGDVEEKSGDESRSGRESEESSGEENAKGVEKDVLGRLMGRKSKGKEKENPKALVEELGDEWLDHGK